MRPLPAALQNSGMLRSHSGLHQRLACWADTRNWDVFGAALGVVAAVAVPVVVGAGSGSRRNAAAGSLAWLARKQALWTGGRAR